LPLHKGTREERGVVHGTHCFFGGGVGFKGGKRENNNLGGLHLGADLSQRGGGGILKQYA